MAAQISSIPANVSQRHTFAVIMDGLKLCEFASLIKVTIYKYIQTEEINRLRKSNFVLPCEITMTKNKFIINMSNKYKDTKEKTGNTEISLGRSKE